MPKKIPMRKCLGCGDMKEKKQLIRVVRTKEMTYEMDLTGKKNGRGAYICHDIDCFHKAAKSKAFERAFSSKIPKEVYEALGKEIGDA